MIMIIGGVMMDMPGNAMVIAGLLVITAMVILYIVTLVKAITKIKHIKIENN